ncbi:hypothetical protein [Mycoplasmopsis opalescens]|uniref:hypothetical protein n=1 Tax=Mycoplasmopsis opalescens TaxID=114886 RepID=UPI0004A6C594|nr:hypothetical protein [Mycoplasmopsis opalescens]
MKIRIKITQNPAEASENIIEFETDSEIQYQPDPKTKEIFRVYTFIEPTYNVENRIEVNENKVNIFSGVATLNLEKNNKTENTFIKIDKDSNEHSFSLFAQLHETKTDDNSSYFSYTIFDGDQNKVIAVKMELMHI